MKSSITAIALAPAVVGLDGDAQLFTRLDDSVALRPQHFGFPQLVNDFFGVVPFLSRGSDHLFGSLPI